GGQRAAGRAARADRLPHHPGGPGGAGGLGARADRHAGDGAVPVQGGAVRAGRAAPGRGGPAAPAPPPGAGGAPHRLACRAGRAPDRGSAPVPAGGRVRARAAGGGDRLGPGSGLRARRRHLPGPGGVARLPSGGRVIGHVTSADGTTVGYRRIGSGPGLVISHGGMGSGYNHLEQAQALADAFTVYLPDRRGRGLSGPFGDGYGVRQDAEDLAAVIAATGARFLFGLSVGGASALAAALTVPAVEK